MLCCVPRGRGAGKHRAVRKSSSAGFGAESLLAECSDQGPWRFRRRSRHLFGRAAGARPTLVVTLHVCFPGQHGKCLVCGLGSPPTAWPRDRVHGTPGKRWSSDVVPRVRHAKRLKLPARVGRRQPSVERLARPALAMPSSGGQDAYGLQSVPNSPFLLCLGTCWTRVSGVRGQFRCV